MAQRTQITNKDLLDGTKNSTLYSNDLYGKRILKRVDKIIHLCSRNEQLYNSMAYNNRT